ncbi:MAG: SIR2-like domain protein [Firmicutes bacterium]|nr:SIR2-like domain protein [Bacillota bacterium]
MAIFLGGGASAAEGAPVQSILFQKYFKTLREKNNYSDSVQVNELRAYFKQMFYIDVLQDNLEDVQFPTFEEAIGLLDLAVRKRQAFKNFDLENLTPNSNRIGYIRQYLVSLMAEVLEDRTSVANGLHRYLVDNLASLGYLKDIFFISTNYDLLIDQALANRRRIQIDYGINFAEDTSSGLVLPEKADSFAIGLYKVHGSLNWSYCPACNSLSLINGQQRILNLLTDSSHSRCNKCQSVRSPVIVPPTYFKDMSNSFINIVWHKTEMSLNDISHLIFCGYSFPNADMHIKYLIKRIQTNRLARLKIIVVNNHPGKTQEKIAEEKERYTRFLGPGIYFTDSSFEEFCNQPEKFIK